MHTLIELYDERAIENVLAPDVFRPQEIIYLCPEEIARDTARQRKYQAFFRHCGWTPGLTFIPCSLYDGEEILRQLLAICDAHPDCALDVTGGTDAALFAGGMLAAQRDVPAFTYSRRMNCFFNIRNAPFADRLTCRVNYRVADFFLMAGGRMRVGRVDNRLLKRYMGLFEPFFALYMRYRRQWPGLVTYIQEISPDSRVLRVSGPMQVKGMQGRRVSIDPAFLQELQQLDMIRELTADESGVTFCFADETVRGWLRDVGSVLELYVYKACLDTGIFGDVVSSAVVDWDDAAGKGGVSNEIDVVAARGVIPMFISCKTCAVKTEALNELAILRDRFGGKGAKAVIVTTEKCNAAARHRAAQLDIAVVDQEELKNAGLVRRLRVVMKAEQD